MIFIFWVKRLPHIIHVKPWVVVKNKSLSQRWRLNLIVNFYPCTMQYTYLIISFSSTFSIKAGRPSRSRGNGKGWSIEHWAHFFFLILAEPLKCSINGLLRYQELFLLYWWILRWALNAPVMRRVLSNLKKQVISMIKTEIIDSSCLAVFIINFNNSICSLILFIAFIGIIIRHI